MRFEARKAAFVEALQMAFNAIPSKTTLQILQNFLLRLTGNQLEITATDLDLTIALKMEVEGHQDGEVVLNARKLLEVAKELPDFPVLLSVDDYTVTIRSESGFHCNLTGFDASEYPGLPEVESGRSLEAALKDFRLLSEKTLFAVSTDTSRMSLTGVLWECRDGQMQMVATDGHRLGKAWIPLPEGSQAMPGVIVPPKAIHQVLRISDDEEARVKVEIGQASAKFSTETVAIFTKLIEGPYPNYQNVIPNQYLRQIPIQREMLAGVLRRVATMAHAKTRQVKFTFHPGQLTLSARNPDLGGDSEESVPVEYEGEPLDIGFNAGYLLEVLRLINTEEVTMKLNSPIGAVMVEPRTTSSNYFFIVMPLRLVEEEA